MLTSTKTTDLTIVQHTVDSIQYTVTVELKTLGIFNIGNQSEVRSLKCISFVVYVLNEASV